MSDRDEKDWIQANEPWRLDSSETRAEEVPVDEIEAVDTWYMKLTKIKGIGKETAEDIGVLYPSLDALRGEVLDGKVPLRNDVVSKLKAYFN